MSIENTNLGSPAPTTKPNQHISPHSRAQTRKQKRLSKNDVTNNNELATPSPESSPSRRASPQTTFPPTSKSLIPRPLKPSMAPARLLIASIGNPAPYLSTLHSAGHTVLYALASILGTSLSKSAREWSHGLLGQYLRSPSGAQWTLWASPTAMNISGTAVAKAWATFLSSQQGRESTEEGRLVVLHDELEAPLGTIKVRSGGASAKGHNGLKSIRDKMPGMPYMRIGIGIGRPESREPGVVAEYVLRKMTREERGRIEGAVGGVLGELRRLSGE